MFDALKPYILLSFRDVPFDYDCKKANLALWQFFDHIYRILNPKVNTPIWTEAEVTQWLDNVIFKEENTSRDEIKNIPYVST